MASLNINTELFLANTTNNSGSLTLPLLSSIPGRVINFKDVNQTFGTNNLTLICSGSDTFEDGATRKVLNEKGGIIQIVGSSKWFILTGVEQNSINTSTILGETISTINISTGSLTTSSIFTSSIYSASTLALFNNNVFAGTRVYPLQGMNRYISTQTFTPSNINGLSFWFDAAFSTSMIVSTNSTILRWNTQSTTNAFYVSSPVNGNLSSVATYAPNVLNGLGAVSLSTTTLISQGPNLVNPTIVFATNYLNSEFTTFTLVNRLSLAQPGTACIHMAQFGGNIRTGASIQKYDYVNPNYNSYLALPFTVTNNVPTIIVGTRQGPTIYIRLNGSNTTSSNNGIDYPVAGAGGTNWNFFIGNNGYNEFYAGYIHEILHYNRALVTSDIQRVEGYLAWKWSIQSNLISNHPFRYLPPY